MPADEVGPFGCPVRLVMGHSVGYLYYSNLCFTDLNLPLGGRVEANYSSMKAF